MKQYNYEHYTMDEMNEIRKAGFETNALLTNKQIDELESKIAKLLNW